jgi:Uma2 family endonuclease
MPILAEHRFTVRDYHRMGEMGVLSAGTRVELLDGRIIDRSPIGPFHGAVVNRLNRLFLLKSRGRWLVSTQNPLRLDEYSEPQPDLMLLKPAPDDYVSHHPERSEVFLLVEVSDTTLEFDREQKLPAYARGGVQEFWIVNLNDQIIEVYCGPNFTAYNNKSVLNAGDRAVPQAFPDLVLEVSELFKR